MKLGCTSNQIERNQMKLGLFKQCCFISHTPFFLLVIGMATSLGIVTINSANSNAKNTNSELVQSSEQRSTHACHVCAHCAHASRHSDDRFSREDAVDRFLELPEDLPAEFTLPVEFGDQVLTLQLTKHRVYGENTRFLIEQGDGELVEHEVPVDRSYVGTVSEHSDYYAVACLTQNGLKAVVTRPDQESLVIEPQSTIENAAGQAARNGMHQVYLQRLDYQCDTCGSNFGEQDDNGNNGRRESSLPSGLARAGESGRSAGSGGPEVSFASSANVMEFEIGVDISFTAWTNRYGSSMSQVDSQMVLLISRLDQTWLQSSMVKHVLGTVIVRTNQSTDPYQSFGSTSTEMLNAFRNRWNSNPGNENGLTHDLAVLHHGNGGESPLWSWRRKHDIGLARFYSP